VEKTVKRQHYNPFKNEPGKPIVNRDKGAIFYCVACHKTYQKCKCRVYVSADTLGRECHASTAQEMASTDVVQLVRKHPKVEIFNHPKPSPKLTDCDHNIIHGI
jgi:hypothetical protein